MNSRQKLLTQRRAAGLGLCAPCVSIASLTFHYVFYEGSRRENGDTQPRADGTLPTHSFASWPQIRCRPYGLDSAYLLSTHMGPCMDPVVMILVVLGALEARQGPLRHPIWVGWVVGSLRNRVREMFRSLSLSGKVLGPFGAYV